MKTSKNPLVLASLGVVGLFAVTSAAMLIVEREGDAKSSSPYPAPEQTLVAPDQTVTAPEPSAQVKLTKINWETSYEDALKKARSSGKPVMVDFYADWCGACKYLDKNVYTDSEVIAESGNFINVKINAEKRLDLHEQFQLRGFPTIVWLDPSGKVLERIDGAPPAPMLTELMKSARSKSTSGSAV